MNDSKDKIDWTLTTWKGSRREQLRRWQQLTVRQRLQAVEDMGELAKKLHGIAQPKPKK